MNFTYAEKSILARIIYGKSLGFIIGILVVGYMYLSANKAFSPELAGGIIIFYIIMGALIAFTGIITNYPIVNIKITYVLRGLIIGFFMHLMLIFLNPESITQIVASIGIDFFQSPYWILIDGSILGIIIDGITTKYAGEGKNLPIQ